LHDIHLGVPVVLGRKGIEQIIELKLNEEERQLLKASADIVRTQLHRLDELGIFDDPEGCG